MYTGVTVVGSGTSAVEPVLVVTSPSQSPLIVNSIIQKLNPHNYIIKTKKIENSLMEVRM